MRFPQLLHLQIMYTHAMSSAVYLKSVSVCLSVFTYVFCIYVCNSSCVLQMEAGIRY